MAVGGDGTANSLQFARAAALVPSRETPRKGRARVVDRYARVYAIEE